MSQSPHCPAPRASLPANVRASQPVGRIKWKLLLMTDAETFLRKFKVVRKCLGHVVTDWGRPKFLSELRLSARLLLQINHKDFKSISDFNLCFMNDVPLLMILVCSIKNEPVVFIPRRAQQINSVFVRK